MRGGDYILMARRRAGLSQRELAERLGCRQATIARWERDDRHPPLAETQAAVRACGLDLAVNLVVADRSWWPQIAVQLERPPIERLRSLTPPGRPDFVPALETIAGTAAIVIGQVAGALHGWPLVLSGSGTVQVSAEPGELSLNQRISIIERPAATSGSRDLARSAQPLTLPSGAIVQVASLLDLLRISDAADAGSRTRETLALQAVVEVQRARTAARPTTTTDDERLQAWLKQQRAAA